MLPERNKHFIFAPRKREEVLKYIEVKGCENKIKIYFQNACQIKKNDYFCIRFEKQAKQKLRHVPRHIELTAVLGREVALQRL